jgi:AmmeMemoRadiSam system protein B
MGKAVLRLLRRLAPALLPLSLWAAGPPSLEVVRGAMAIPSTEGLRGQQDGVGFAVSAEQMARVAAFSREGPAPEGFGRSPEGTVLGAVCPHDDYLYAGRMFRTALAPVTAKTVIVLGVFHKWRVFDARDRLIFDPYPAWRAPDGEVPVSALREALLARLPEGDWTRDAASHDAEHSVEPIVFWLRHENPTVEILPVLVPTMDFERMKGLVARLAEALRAVLAERGLRLGRDVQVVISSDAVHYGTDFDYAPFGEGGPEAYALARAQDRRLMRENLSGKVTEKKARGLFERLVDPKDPGRYRIPWCGRFTVPFGMLFLKEMTGGDGLRTVPAAYATSVDGPQPDWPGGPGRTAPAHLRHFVGYPAAWFCER